MKSPVQIRRTTTLAEGSQLLEGELGYSYDSDKLFIGGAGAASNVEVGGASFLSLLSATPGTATADKAVILDSNTKIDVWNVTGLVEADTFKTSASVNAGFVKNDGLGNLLFGQTGEQTDLDLTNLADVTIVTPLVGEYLCFAGPEWVNAAIPLNDLSDVSLTSPGLGEFLRNDGAGQFVNVTLTDTDIPDDLTLGTVSGNVAFTGNVLPGADVIMTTTTAAVYFGDPLTDGSWRMMRDIGDTEDLLIQERILSSWVTKGSFTT